MRFNGAGIYRDIPELDYHSGSFGPDGGSLSSTEAKRVLESPATYMWFKTHPQPASKAFDLGHIVHSLVLGTGLEVVAYPEETLGKGGAATTKAAREFAAQARASGQIPVKEEDLEVPAAMAEAVLAHPTARMFFETGAPEVSIYAQNMGVWMRGRVDWVHTPNDNASEVVLIDLKTTASVPTPTNFARTAATYHYGLQREWYRYVWQANTGIAPEFIHVAVAKTPPYLVSVIELDAEFEQIGKTQMSRALTTWRACNSSGVWPGLPVDTCLVGPPAWYANTELDEEE